MRNFLFLVFLSVSLGGFAQTYRLSGHVYNKNDESEILIGVHVIYESGKGVVTNLDGNYSVDLRPGEYTIIYSYVGFESATRTVNIVNKPVVVDVGLEPVSIGEVVVVADVARSRETPIAFSTITPVKLQENLAGQDIPMLLNSTPGVYATQEGGGDGDAQVTIRGFSARNVGVLLDGVPVNDMETGHVYWSNWFGLDAVTRSIQVQRGLGASKLALPSVGGTINIITKGMESKKGGSLTQEVGSDGYLRTSFGYNTGKLKNGWGISAAGSYKRGDGWVDQTWSNGFFYYLKIDKKIGNHMISLSGYGAPQSHGQRSYKLPVAVYDSAYAEELGIRLAYDEFMSAEDSSEVNENRRIADEGIGRGLRFNQHWGYLIKTEEGPNAEREIINEKVNHYHKPQFTLKDFWKVSDRFYVSNIAYLSIGRGGGVSSASTIAPDENGLKRFQSIYDRTISENAVYPAYDTALHLASNYLVNRANEHFWYGLLSTVNYRPNNNLNFSAGFDLRRYTGKHYEQVYDLMGGDYALPEYPDYDLADYTSVSPFAALKLQEGDKNVYHNDGEVKWGGLFFQTEYKNEKVSTFINLTTAISSYQRIDYMFGLNANVKQFKTEWNNYPGVTIKGGLNYNLNDKMNVFFNAGYLSKAPRFNNVYDRDNLKFREISNEFVKAIEAGYSFSSPIFSANLNAYYTIWENKPADRTSKIEVEGEEFSVNINGMDALHKGIELDFILRASHNVDIQGVISIGDWRWNTEDTFRVYDDNNNLAITQYYDARGVHVGNSAQNQAGIEIRWEPIENFYIKPAYVYFINYYSAFDPVSLNGSPNSYVWYDEETGEHGDPRDSWKIPAY